MSSGIMIPRFGIAICRYCRARVRRFVGDEPLPHTSACPVGQRDRLREILAPLLADPFEGDTGTICCRFCDRSLGGGDDLAYSPRDDARFVHAAGCPVLDKDRLLGRPG